MPLAGRSRRRAEPGVNPRGSSRIASGFPPVSATIRSSTDSSRRAGEHGLQQRPCIAATQRLDAELREAGQPRCSSSRVANTSAILLREQATSHERERSSRSAVEPLRVVDHAQQRLLLGSIGEEAESREPNEKRARRRPGAQTESDTKRVTLRISQTLAELEKRRTELLQRRVVELHLPLDARSANDAKVLARLDSVFEQRGLTDARVSVDHENTAVTVPPVSSSRSSTARSRCLPSNRPDCDADDHPGSMPLGSWTAESAKRTTDPDSRPAAAATMDFRA